MTAKFSEFLKEGQQSGWSDSIAKAPRFSPRQDSLNNQLADLQFVANKLGFQDAADFLKQYIKR